MTGDSANDARGPRDAHAEADDADEADDRLRSLAEREALMAEAEAIAGVGSYLWEPGTPPRWSDGMFRVLGYAPGSVTPSAEAFYACVHPDDRERVASTHAAATRGVMPDAEYRILRADTGEERHLRGVGRVYDRPGGALRLVGALIDVTESRRTAHANERALRMMRAAERMAPMGSFLVQPESQEIHWSEGLRELTGLHEMEADAQQRFELMHPDDRGPYMVWWNELLAIGSVPPIQSRMIRTDGELRHLVTHASLVRFESDGVERVMGTTLDVTERVHLEEKLRHMAKMEAVGTLAAGVAHDFNNYLMVIAGCLDLVVQRAGPESTPDDLMGHAQHAVSRCMDLTQELLAFARRRPSRAEVIDLRDALRRIAPLLQATLGRNVRLELDVPDEAVRARIDPAHLEQLLANLAINGRDAIAAVPAQGGRLVIRVSSERLTAPVVSGMAEVAPGAWTRIDVSDDGCGIAEEHLARIFDPYFTTKALGRGTGLGLSSVYGAVQQHGGHVTVSSELGKGTTFRIWLPGEPGERKRTSRPAPTSDRPSRTPRILVVDDLPQVRHVAALALRGAGFEVEEAEDGVDALERIEAGDFDLVLTDVRMPRMDGLALSGVLQERYPQLPVILMSGYSELPDSGLTLPVLDKPIGSEQLIAEVNKRLGPYH